MRQAAPFTRLRWAGVILLALVASAGIGLRAISASDGAGVAFRRGNLIRLHILANSDAPADQQVKLQVRDDLLREGERLFRTVQGSREAEEIVQRNLNFFRQVAERRLQAEGFAYQARVEYGIFPFPERTYGRLTLPAGQYTALRVVLGRGAGHNWWCVLFPPLCFLDMDNDLARGRVRIVREGERKTDQTRVAVKLRLNLPEGPAHPVPLSILPAPVGP